MSSATSIRGQVLGKLKYPGEQPNVDESKP